MRTLSNILILSLLAFPAALSAGEPGAHVETFMANVVAMDAPGGMATDTLVLRVERWMDPKEARVLSDLLGQKGMEAFQKAVTEQDLGSLRSVATIGWPINWALSERTAEGRSVQIILERPLLGRELARLDRTADYPFVVVEFTIGADGKGKGRVVPAAKLRPGAKGDLEVLPYSEPNEQRIIGVKRVEP